MQIASTNLTRAAGLAAVASGLLFTAVQVKHPEITLDFVTTTQWKVRQGMKVAMATLALAGIAGMYLRQVRQIGILGLVGYLLFSLGYLAMLCVETIALVVIPTVAQSAPEYVNGVVAVATNSSSSVDLGLFRLGFGSAMAVFIVLGFVAIRSGDVASHRAWMIRAYALALAAGTQAFTQGVAKGVLSPSTLTTDLALGAGWVINLVVAELIIHRYARPASALTVVDSP